MFDYDKIKIIKYFDGVKCYYNSNGQYHRLDGPAILQDNGIATTEEACQKQWYYKGKYIDCNDQETFERLLKLKAFW